MYRELAFPYRDRTESQRDYSGRQQESHGTADENLPRGKRQRGTLSYEVNPMTSLPGAASELDRAVKTNTLKGSLFPFVLWQCAGRDVVARKVRSVSAASLALPRLSSGQPVSPKILHMRQASGRARFRTP